MADKKDNIVLSIRDMSKSFGRNRVLTRINLDVKAGTVMGLMGENQRYSPGAGTAGQSGGGWERIRRLYHGQNLPGWERGKFFRTEGGVGKRYRYGSPGIESVSGEKCS